MDFFGEDILFTIIILIALFLIVTVIVGSYYHVHKAKFKPKFRKLSDGSLQMEFSGFAGLQTSRTKRFYEQYKVGMKIEYDGKFYEIEEIKEQAELGVARTDQIMVCYLREVE